MKLPPLLDSAPWRFDKETGNLMADNGRLIAHLPLYKSNDPGDRDLCEFFEALPEVMATILKIYKFSFIKISDVRRLISTALLEAGCYSDREKEKTDTE